MNIYYVPNGGISLLPDIRGLGTIKVFGCNTPEDYGDGKVLFWQRTDAADVMANEVGNFQPDLIFIEPFTPDMLDAIIRIRKFYHGRIVGFYGDCIVNEKMSNLLSRIGKYINLLLVVDKPAEDALRSRKIKAEFTIWPASKSLYQHHDLAKQYDVIMAGNAYSKQSFSSFSNTEQRIQLVRILSKNIDNFALFGRPETWSKYEIQSKGWVDEYKLAEIYNKTKIIVSCDSVIEKQFFTSNRTYNVLCTGSFLLLRKFEGIEELFVNKKHLVWFETNEEALELIKYYLEHDDERQTIAHQGMEHLKQRPDQKDSFINWCWRENEPLGEITQEEIANDKIWLVYDRVIYKSMKILLIPIRGPRYLFRKAKGLLGL